MTALHTDHDVSTRPKYKPSADCDSPDYQLPSSLSDRPTSKSGHTSPIPFQHSPTHLQVMATLMSKVHNTTGSAGLQWQMEEY